MVAASSTCRTPPPPTSKDVIVVEAGPGDKVVIPPGWAHATVNVGDAPMAFGAVYALDAQLLYEPLRRLQGTAHYVLADGTLSRTRATARCPRRGGRLPTRSPSTGSATAAPRSRATPLASTSCRAPSATPRSGSAW